MARVDVPLSRLRFGETQRRDAWWVTPLVVFTILSSFLVYATWAALQGAHFRWGPYLSPFYSPLLFPAEGPSWFGKPPGWLPLWITPAMLILPIPGRLSPHLLLLSRRLLQGILGRPALVRRR